MKIFENVNGFEWDEFNQEKNWLKHTVHWSECEEVFFNEPIYIYSDNKHSASEQRYFSLGHTYNDRFLFVVFTIRNNKIRIISARDMSKKEKIIYEKNSCIYK